MGEILGTVTYLSPEQISRREVSPTGDVYALGVVFYELLTLEKPFLGDNPGEIVRAILDSEPLDPVRFRSDLPEDLNRLVLRMLSKEPAERPDAEEVGREIMRLGGSPGRRATTGPDGHIGDTDPFSRSRHDRGAS